MEAQDDLNPGRLLVLCQRDMLANSVKALSDTQTYLQLEMRFAIG